MYCRNCGRELPEDAKFCINCGTSIEPLKQGGNAGKTFEGEKKTVKGMEQWTEAGPLIALLCLFPLWSFVQNVLWQYLYNIKEFYNGTMGAGDLVPAYLVGHFKAFGFDLFPNWVIWLLGIVVTAILVGSGKIRLTDEDRKPCFSYMDTLVIGIFSIIWPLSCAAHGYIIWYLVGEEYYHGFLDTVRYIEAILVSPQLVFWGLLIFFMLCRGRKREGGRKGKLIAGGCFVLLSVAAFLAAIPLAVYMNPFSPTAKEGFIIMARAIALFLWLRLAVLSGFMGVYGKRYLKTVGGILGPLLILVVMLLWDYLLFLVLRLGANTFLFPLPWIVSGIMLGIVWIIGKKKRISA